jgi:hypothetical protein
MLGMVSESMALSELSVEITLIILPLLNTVDRTLGIENY